MRSFTFYLLFLYLSRVLSLEIPVLCGDEYDSCPANRTRGPTCFNKSDPICNAKHNVPDDYDYLVVEYLFVPQFCRELDRGIDPTRTHGKGKRCNPALITQAMLLHGIWPNYYGGFPSCCRSTSRWLPLREFFHVLPPRTQSFISQKYVDPTGDSLCVLFNHELQKHGECMTQVHDASIIRGAVWYANALVHVAAELQKAITFLEAWTRDPQADLRVNTIQSLVPSFIQIYCSHYPKANQLLALRICFPKTANFSTFMDCPPPMEYGEFHQCNPSEPVKVDDYVVSSPNVVIS